MPHKVRVSNLKRKRIEKGMKQAELSEASGVPVKCIGNYEQLRRDINHAQVGIVYRLACALGCKMEELLELEKLKKSVDVPSKQSYHTDNPKGETKKGRAKI